MTILMNTVLLYSSLTSLPLLASIDSDATDISVHFCPEIASNITICFQSSEKLAVTNLYHDTHLFEVKKSLP